MSFSVRRWLIFWAALTAAAAFLLPLLWMVLASFMPDEAVMAGAVSLGELVPRRLTLSNYGDVFRRVAFLRHVGVSLGFTLTVVGVGLFVNSACGFAFARLEMPGREWLFAGVTALIVIPFEALAIPLFLLVGVDWGLMNTLPGLFLPYLAKAFNIYFMRQYFLSLPEELEEAARVEGATWFHVFWHVGLPLAVPALATCAVLDFITHWSEYLWPLIITNRPDMETVQVGLGHFFTLPPIQWGDIMAYSVMATLPMVLIFAFCQRYLRQSFATSGLKG